MSFLILAFAVLGTLAIFATTQSGQAILKCTALRDRIPGAASSADVEYLYSACGGDRAEVERRVAVERERFPELKEADHYRRAIRKVIGERGESPLDGLD